MNIKKFAGLLLFVSVILFPDKCSASGNPDIYLNNEKISSEITYIINGRTYLSLEDISRIFSLNIKKDLNSGCILLSKDDIKIYANSKTVYCDGIHFGSLKGEEAVKNIQGNPHIPVRYISNALHKDICYNSLQNAVFISDIDSKIIYPLLLTDSGKYELSESDTSIHYYDNHYVFYNDSINECRSLESFSSFLNSDYEKSPSLLDNSIFIMHPDRGYIVGGLDS